MVYKYIILVCMLLVFASCGAKQDEGVTKEAAPEGQNLENFQNGEALDISIPTNNKISLEGYSDEELNDITMTLNSNDFTESNRILQSKIDKLTALEDVNTEEVVQLLMLQLQNTLNQGNYEYNEKGAKERGNQIIDQIVSYDPDAISDPYILASRGYMEEIIKNYDEAINFYQQAYDIAKLNDGTESFQAHMLNQIGHVFGLQSLYNEAYNYTYQAFMIDPYNLGVNSNLGRYLVQAGRVKESIQYFEYALNTENKPMRSEIYFTLSSLFSEKTYGTDVYDIQKAIEYAELSIESNDKYPMGYYALAKAYYMFNDQSYYGIMEENLVKAIEINPNSYNAHELLGLLKMDMGNFEEAVQNILTAIEVIPYDMLLMEDQRLYNSDRLYMLIILMNHVHEGKAIDDTFEVLFLADENSIDNITFQFERENYGFLGELGPIITELYLN